MDDSSDWWHGGLTFADEGFDLCEVGDIATIDVDIDIQFLQLLDEFGDAFLVGSTPRSQNDILRSFVGKPAGDRSAYTSGTTGDEIGRVRATDRFWRRSWECLV